jgi:uncharacterized repeat protein (TIGR01451 family)
MNMKRWSLVTGAAIAFIGFPLVSGPAVLANLQQASASFIAAIQGAEVKLQLKADKKIVTINAEGEEVITWKDLGAKAQVFPGDTLRYSVQGENIGDKNAENLVVNQDIPEGTVYVLASAQSDSGTSVTFSIDDGKTFVANPTIKVQQPDGSLIEEPAPAEMYTDLKWDFSETLAPQLGVDASYEVQIP